jgi:hypothetical protein
MENLYQDVKEYNISNDEIKLCTATMLGIVLKWQPKVEHVKEVCLKPFYNYSITATIFDNCLNNDRYSSSLLIILANQLSVSGFWGDDKKQLEKLRRIVTY